MEWTTKTGPENMEYFNGETGQNETDNRVHIRTGTESGPVQKRYRKRLPNCQLIYKTGRGPLQE